MTNEMLFDKVLRRLRLSEKDIRSRRRTQSLVDARCLLAAALMRQPLINQQQVAAILGISQGAVSKMLARHEDLLQVDPLYRNKWNSINS